MGLTRMARSWVLWVAACFVSEAAMAALLGDLLAGRPPATLGAGGGRLAPCPAKPNCVTSQATDDAHAVAPFAYTGDASQALDRLVGVIAAQPRARVVMRGVGYVHVEFRSKLLGFVDDLELQVDPAARVIHVRSASRLGYGDFGVNRARVDALRTAYGSGER
jgi:uncharacterized protein (DUF1499 family)